MLENKSNYQSLKNLDVDLAVYPNHLVAGGPNPYCKKINLNNFEYKILDKQEVYSDQPLSAVHRFLSERGKHYKSWNHLTYLEFPPFLPFMGFNKTYFVQSLELVWTSLVTRGTALQKMAISPTPITQPLEFFNVNFFYSFLPQKIFRWKVL